MTNIYAQAVKYVGLGWGVIPLKPNSKEPLIPWLEYQKRMATPEELKKWFQGTKNNVGIVTGSLSNISVVDVDTLKLLAELPISSIVVLTARGRHLYFKYSGETNSASKIAEHVDVRGEGGFVVAPPSGINGFRYRFINSNMRTSLLKPFPKELLANAERHAVSGDGGKSNDWLSQALEGIREGNRNDTFAKLVGRLHRDKHSAGNILALLRPHAELHSFPIEELENVIQSVTRYENQRGGQGTGDVLYGPGDKAENIETFLEGDERVTWIVPNVIAKSSIGFCAGLPETFKTWIMADLAIECARENGNWLGQAVKQTKTLFIDQERFKGETRRRFKKMLKAKGLTAKDLHDKLYIQVGSSVRLNLEESFESFRRKLAEIRPELVIVDSFATFSTVAENDRQEVQKVLERVKQLRQEFGCTFLFIDHEGKSVLNPDNKGEVPDAYKMVGSVGKPAAAETVLTVRKENANKVTLYHTKSTLAPAISPRTIEIVDTEDGGIKLVTL